MSDYYPKAVKTDIDGRTFFVSPHPSAACTYLAGANDPDMAEALLGAGAALPALNVQAIEKVTGHQVLIATINNTQSGATWAAVDC